MHKNPSQTFYNQIYQIPGSYFLTIDSNLKLTSKKYWDPKISSSRIENNNEYVSCAKKLLFDSLKIRLRADVPLGICLSGGVDSAAIASIVSKQFNIKTNTYSIIDYLDIKYNEEENINLIVKDINSNHYPIYLSEIKSKSKKLDRLKQLIKYRNGPLSTITWYLHSFLTEEMSKKGIKVSFSGTAADEIYGGYYDHQLQYLLLQKNNR